MRAQEFLKKRSTENLDEGVIDFISKSKDKFLRLKDALSDEWAQTKEMWEIVQKRKTATQKEINFANSQFKDILRVAGLSAWYALPIPGNTLLILATEKILNKVGMSIIPDKIRNQVLMSKQQGVAEGDKMSLINLDQSLANTPPVWKKFISSLPPQLAREFVDERPRPDQDDIDFLTPLRLVSPQPVSVRVADLLRHPENQGTIGRSPDDVVAAVNQRWGLKIPSGKKYDPNPARYRAYAQMASGTASPSVMADGVILFGAGRFVAAALRGDETMRVWSMTRKQGVTEGPQR